MIILDGLEDSFDNDSAEEMLNLSIDRMTRTSDLVRKSMYDFDLQTPEGIEKLMALIPIMDPEILKDIMGEIWPGYPTDVDARRHRLEIKGYLKDYLENYDQEDAVEQSGSIGGSSEAGQAPSLDGEASQDPAAAVPPAGQGPQPSGNAAGRPGVQEQTTVAQNTPT